jgi:hypothetical protein
MSWSCFKCCGMLVVPGFVNSFCFVACQYFPSSSSSPGSWEESELQVTIPFIRRLNEDRCCFSFFIRVCINVLSYFFLVEWQSGLRAYYRGRRMQWKASGVGGKVGTREVY